MSSVSLLPLGSTLGMLGGGQLGGFFTEAALRMGYKVAVWDPDPLAPAKRYSTYSIDAPFDDEEQIIFFSNTVDAISLEWENVPSRLVTKLEHTNLVKPGSKSLKLAQNRIEEKTFLSSNNFPVTPHEFVLNAQEFKGIKIPKPWIVKTATLGYDGHGQWKIENDTQERELLKTIHGESWVIESVVDYRLEMSVIIVSNGKGNLVAYPPTENTHQGGILRMSISPPRLKTETQNRAIDLAKEVIGCLDDAGVFCVEMFLTATDEILVNEIAPRPHNSGHHTIDAFSISQYESQVRALVGLPVIEPDFLNASVLLNILGEEANILSDTDHKFELYSDSSARLYMYGKQSVRPRRKMGHVMFLGGSVEDLISKAENTLRALKN